MTLLTSSEWIAIETIRLGRTCSFYSASRRAKHWIQTALVCVQESDYNVLDEGDSRKSFISRRERAWRNGNAQLQLLRGIVRRISELRRLDSRRYEMMSKLAIGLLSEIRYVFQQAYTEQEQL